MAYIMNGIMKGMILVLVALYAISPVDACPGPVDDLIVILMGIAATRIKNERE